jgi:hypothetical protein
VRHTSAGCVREDPGFESQPDQIFFTHLCILSFLSHPLLVIFENSERHNGNPLILRLTKSSQAPNE